MNTDAFYNIDNISRSKVADLQAKFNINDKNMRYSQTEWQCLDGNQDNIADNNIQKA